MLLFRGALGCALCLVVANSAVSADSGGDLDVQVFRPALDAKGIVTLDRSGVLMHLETSFGLVTNWATGLVGLENGETTYDVENMISPTLVGALGVRPFGLDMQLALAIPFHVMSGDRGPDDNRGTPSDPNDDKGYALNGQGLGNIAVQLKWRLRKPSHSQIGMALVVGADLPTVSAPAHWLGTPGTTPYARIAVDREFGLLGVAANVGVRIPLGASEFVDDTSSMGAPVTGQRIAIGPAIPLGVGVSYGIVPEKFAVVGEVFGQYAPSGEDYQPLEALAGIKVYLADSSFLSFGGGIGLLPDRAGNPSWRTYLGIVFEPKVADRDHDGRGDDVDSCPEDPEDYDDFEDSDGCPYLDNDGDGIADADDACPNTPENPNGIDDDNGCPESSSADRDADGIVDTLDRCPDTPEDSDDFEDADGCPDRDNDNDRILDVDDLCPEDPEDVDQFEDADGCPDRDNDNDRILDDDDDCPRVDGETAKETKEVWNTVDDDDGCPDRGPIIRSDGSIVVLKKIHFEYDSDVIKAESFGILHAIAMTIHSNPDIERIEVQGHTDERGRASYNRRLSQRRADAVLRILVAEGVAETRLRAVGYGEARPKHRKHTEAAWAINRRVEFIITR